MKQFVMYIAVSALLIAATVTPSSSENSKLVADGMKVTIEYTASAPEKALTVTTDGQPPVSYIQGTGELNPVLEHALYGLHAGDRKTVLLSPEEGFGRYDSSKKSTVPKSRLPADIQLGTILQDSLGRLVTVAAITNESVVLDLNHPFAGQNIVFDIHILNVENLSSIPHRRPAPGGYTKMSAIQH
jgi:FKBP-type peptidyl-prolyl cis-trans isomerase 2